MVDIQSEEYKLGQNIRKYRLAKGWSQMDLSNAVDIDRTDISKYENGSKGEIPMYDLERTVCDLMRSRNSIEVQEFNSVIKAYSFFSRLSSVGNTDLALVTFRSWRLKLSMVLVV